MMITVMERKGTTVTTVNMTSKIPDNVSMISVFATNPFISDGDYQNDGYIYVGGKPVRKWFKKIEGVSVWFPIFNDLHKLQERFYKIKQAHKDFVKNEYAFSYDQLLKIKKAHAKVTHKYQGNDDPWWFYQTEKYSGISGDWVKAPEKPVNLEIGNRYYKAEQRLMQIGSRVCKFRIILEHAIKMKVCEIQGRIGQLLQIKIDDKVYWFKYSQYSWEKIAFPEDDVKTVIL